MTKILKFWHTWNWAIHGAVWIIIATALWYANNQNAIANNAMDIAEIKAQKLPERMVRQEQITENINDNLREIKTVQGKIFDRINQIADRAR